MRGYDSISSIDEKNVIKMLKIGCLWMMLSISVTAFAQDTSSDCDKEYYDRYGRWMENHLVTWWGVPQF